MDQLHNKLIVTVGIELIMLSLRAPCVPDLNTNFLESPEHLYDTLKIKEKLYFQDEEPKFWRGRITCKKLDCKGKNKSWSLQST